MRLCPSRAPGYEFTCRTLTKYATTQSRVESECATSRLSVRDSGRRCRSLPPLCVDVEAAPAAHIGLGSKTTVLLSFLTAARAELRSELTDAQLQAISGRAGTSGIGLHSFFQGGLIIDGGHPAGDERRYQPSSAGSSGRIPPILAALSLPTDWVVALILVDGLTWSAQAERDFFDQNTPIDCSEVDRVVTIACMDLLSAAIEGDLLQFAVAIGELQHVGFSSVRLRFNLTMSAGYSQRWNRIQRLRRA